MAKSVHQIKTLGGNSVAIKLLASILRIGDIIALYDKKGRQLDYAKVGDKQGRTEEDAKAFIETVKDYCKKMKDPMLQLLNGNFVKCSAIEAVEQHSGRDHKGIVIRSEGDAILDFIEIPVAEARERVVNVLHDTLEAYAAGKFTQPDWKEILNVTTETN